MAEIKIVAIFFAFIAFALFLDTALSGMSEAQIKAAGKVVRNLCQPKSKVTNEQIENMHKGKWEEVEPVKCYMACVAQRMKMLKNGTFDHESVTKQMASLPEKLKEPMKEVIEKCKDSIKSEEKCQAGFELTKCIYTANPEIYFLP